METLIAPPPVDSRPVAVPTVAPAPISSPISSPLAAPPAHSPKPGWIDALAQKLAIRGVTPGALVIASAATSVLAAMLVPLGTLVPSGVGTGALVIAALCIQLRFVCRIVGGRIGGMMSGEVSTPPTAFDGVLDLLADALILAATGYAASATVAGPILGWTCALLGVVLAHVLLLDGAKGPTGDLTDLASTRRRMAVVTAACVLAALVPYGWRQPVVLLALATIAAACAIAIWFRMVRLAEMPEGG